jgi:MFS family permease
MYLGRVATGMLEIAVVLFALDEFDSPAVAGLAAFLGAFPGLLGAPVMGALLDRFGRIRIILLGYLTAAAALVLISLLALVSALSVALFLVIVTSFGFTQVFSEAGLRSLLPRVAPGELWERVNGIDASSYLTSWIIGPPVAAILVGSVGGEAAFLTVAALSLAAWACLHPVHEPTSPSTEDEVRGIVRLTLEGLRYVARNRTLRGLGLSVCVANVSFGMVTILVSVMVVQELQAPHAVVGLAFTLSGLAGALSALVAGRTDTRGREWRMLVLSMTGVSAAAALLLPGVGASRAAGVFWVLLAMVVMGLSHGVWDITIFTLRQRRTDPRLMGRAFAISMALNWSGIPIGAALGGYLADSSVGAAVVVSVVAACAGTLVAMVLVPRRDDAAVSGGPMLQPPEH